MAVEMKDTGIEWIKKIPKDWTYARLKYINKNITDGSHFSPEIIDEGKKYITVANIYDNEIHLDEALEISEKDFYELSRAGCKPHFDDVLLTKDGTVGRTAIVQKDNDYVILSSIGILTPGNKIKSKFLKFALDSNYLQEQMVGMKDGSALKRITISKIREFFICYPSITEQDKIADFLDKQTKNIDAIIKTNEQQLEILKKYKKALITETVTKGLNKNVKMKDSGVDWIGKIPYNWEMQRLKYVLTKNNPIRVGPFGTALTTSDYTDEGQWVYNQRVVLDKNFMENDTFISEEKAKELKGFKVFSGDLLITTRGTIGKVAKVPENCKDGVLHPCIIRFRVEEGKLPYKLINVLFNESDFVLDQITRFSNATTIDVIYSETLKNLIVPIIPQDELTVITSYLDKQCTKINCLINKKQQAIDTMQKYKKSLIYEYVTGKKRIK